MTLEQYASFAEIIGLMLIIATLFYVARQLSQNTTIMRVTAASERMKREFEIALPVIENRAFAEIWLKGRQDFDALDDLDKQRLLFFERRVIMLWHHLFQLREQNLLPEANWNEQLWAIRNFGRSQPLRKAWGLFKGAFSSPFQEFMDNQFVIADKGAVDE